MNRELTALDPESQVPLYQQLYDEILHLIEIGVYKEGERIPSEDQLRTRYNVSRITVRNALQRLVEDQYLIRRHGKGTFVAQVAHIESMVAKNSFTKSCLQMKIEPSTKVVDISIGIAGKREETIFQIKQGEKIIVIKRLRYANNIPVMLEVDYFTIDFHFMLEKDLERIPLQETLYKEKGYIAHKAEDIFEVAYATKEQSTQLQCNLGDALLKVSQTVRKEDGSILYYNEQFICSERYKYAVSSII